MIVIHTATPGWSFSDLSVSVIDDLDGDLDGHDVNGDYYDGWIDHVCRGFSYKTLSFFLDGWNSYLTCLPATLPTHLTRPVLLIHVLEHTLTILSSPLYAHAHARTRARTPTHTLSLCPFSFFLTLAHNSASSHLRVALLSLVSTISHTHFLSVLSPLFLLSILSSRG